MSIRSKFVDINWWKTLKWNRFTFFLSLIRNTIIYNAHLANRKLLESAKNENCEASFVCFLTKTHVPKYGIYTIVIYV